MRRTVACALAIALCCVPSGCARKAKGPPEIAGGASYIPSDAAAVAVIHVKRIMESKLLEPVFKDTMIAEQIKQSPVDLRKIEQVTAVAVPRKGGQQPSRNPFAAFAVVRFTEPTDAIELLSRLAPPNIKFEKRTHQAVAYYTGDKDNFFFQPDEKTLAVAEQEETLKEVLSGGAAKGPITEKLQAAGTADDVVAVVLLEPMRDLLKEAAANIPPPAMATVPLLKDAATLPDELKSATVTINFSSDTLAKLVLECTSAELAQKANDTLKKALDGIKPLAGMAVMMARTSADTPQAAKDAMDVGLRLLDGIKLAAAGDQVVVTVAKPKGLERLVATVPQTIADAQAQARDAASRAARQNNLKQVALGLLNYEARPNAFPPAALCDKQGKPLLSWRVAILPYLDEKALYDQFRLDEPWDSPNNKKLLDRMPRIFRGQRTEKDGKTTIMLFTGKDAPFEEGKRLSLDKISASDGVSNTIMAVEAGPDKAVPWTKPEDLPFDPRNPRAVLGNVSPEYFLAVMFDGSVHTLKTDMSAETLRRLANPWDGQPVNVSEATWTGGAKARASFGPGLKGSPRVKPSAPPSEKK